MPDYGTVQGQPLSDLLGKNQMADTQSNAHAAQSMLTSDYLFVIFDALATY